MSIRSRLRQGFPLSAIVALVVGLAALSAPALVVPAQAQGAAPVTLTDLTVAAGSMTYRIHRVEIRGGNLSEAEARSLFDASAGGSLPERLARLSAQEIVVPEITIEQPLGGGRQTTTYRDVVLSGVSNGKVATIIGESGSFATSGIEKGGRGRFGRLAASEVDLAQSISIYFEKAAPGADAYRQLYASISLDALVVEGPDGMGVKVGRMLARDLKARPTPDSWMETIRLLGTQSGKGKRDPAEETRAMSLSADLLEAFDFGSFELIDLESVAPSGSDQPQVRVTRLSFAGAQAGRPSEARLEGIEVKSPQANVRLSTLSFSDFSFKPVIAGLRSLREKTFGDIDPREARKFIPVLGTTRLSGFDAEFREDSSGAGPTYRVGLKNFEFAAEKPLNGIPTSLRVTLDNMTFPVPADAGEDFVKDLAALGYRSADLSSNLSLLWNEAGGELALRDFSLRGAAMGAVSLRGTFGNVSRDLFDPDTAIATVALVGATLRNVDITVENAGLAEKLLAQQAAGQKRTPEELRREYGMTAAVGIPALLGNSPQAKALGSAVARFIARPNRLAVSARARDGVGLGAADVALIGDPNALLGKIEVIAKAE